MVGAACGGYEKARETGETRGFFGSLGGTCDGGGGHHLN
jgi:hypothetical protein